MMFKTRYRIAERSKGWFQIEKKSFWSRKWMYVNVHQTLEQAEDEAKRVMNPFIKYL